MIEDKSRRLSDAVSVFAPEGTNDARWFQVEHQLTHAKISIEAAHSSLMSIINDPENAGEREIAWDCHEIVRAMYLDILGHHAAFKSYLSDTDVPERIARKER